ncbi:hypothetical protein BpHYR1_020376 [Brachionus plicatilis]|uniref:Uncharacterized protein n=1 Tax=Brachionus plicatilis TaxID=10195 RepID=A0A3M7R742_BRAPC|nr:hypothetical protein BpHYR1_020376 [Brachionus plicatilis]
MNLKLILINPEIYTTKNKKFYIRFFAESFLKLRNDKHMRKIFLIINPSSKNLIIKFNSKGIQVHLLDLLMRLN